MRGRAFTVASGAALGLALALRAVCRIPVFELDVRVRDPWLLTTLPRWWWLVALVGLGAAVGWLMPRRAAGPCLFAGASAGAVFLPFAFDWAPFLAAFSGRFLDFVLVCGALVLAWRFVPAPSRPSALGVVLLSGCSFVAVVLMVSRDVGLSGDEPHYVLITHSLVEDGDLEVENNYLAGDYQHFYLGKIGPHLARNTPYSVHGIGLPILLVPGYAIAGVGGVIATLVLLGTLVVLGVFRTARGLGVSDAGAALSALAFALSSPALFLCVSAYPELPAAVIVTLTAWRLVRRSPSTVWSTVGLSLMVGSLPFFHMKFIPLAVVLWLALAYRGARVGVAAGAIVSAVALMAFFYYTTGSIDPTASYGRQRVFLSAIPAGLLGLAFDQEYGLFVYAPVYLIGLVGLVALARRQPFVGLFAVAVVGAVALPGAAHPLWFGGSSPPARFLFPALPLLALGVGCLWSWEKKSGVAPWLPVLLSVSVAVSLFTVLLPGQPLYLNARDGTGRLWEALSSSWDITPYLPSIINGDVRSFALALGGVALVIVAIVLQARQRAVPLPAFALVLLALAWAQDLTGVVQPRAQEGRWVTGLWHRIADEHPSRFLAIPTFAPLGTSAVSERVPLWLAALQPDGDAEHWWSRAYTIPAGSYVARGVLAEGWAPCNDRECFDVEDARFETHVALLNFRARARRFDDPPPRLQFTDLWGDAPTALRSLAFSDGRRLHGLDENAYLDPKGFWVRRGARAHFVLEPGGELSLANGGRDNTVVVRTSSGEERHELAPWARLLVSVPERFSIESEGGFQPMELDPASEDYRQLGVFVAQPPFDFGR